MHRTKIRLAVSVAVIAVTVIIAQLILATREEDQRIGAEITTESDNNDADDSQIYSEVLNGQRLQRQRTTELILPPIPLEALAWAADRGYPSAAENGQLSKRPYEYYEQETLEHLAAEGDGLAQLIVAERLSFSDPQEADRLYIEAAINGKTAGLTNAAGDRLLIVPGQTGYGFPTTDQNGNISDRYLDVLRFYAAAEFLGDFVGTAMLQAHVETPGLGSSPRNIGRICERGEELANAIWAERLRRWGSLDNSILPKEWAETPDPICRQP